MSALHQSILGVMPTRLGRVAPAFGVWCVGSTALHGLQRGRDIDLIVPPHHWREWARRILHKGQTDSPDPVPTSHGGWRWSEAGWSFDTWPDALDALVDKAMHARGEFPGAVSLRTGARLLHVGLYE